jgi:hypothetical protein
MQVRAADFGRARAVGLIRVLVGAHRPGRAVDCTPGRAVDCTPGREAGCTQARVQIRIEAISRRETHYWTTYNEPVNIRSSLCCCRRAFDDQQ